MSITSSILSSILIPLHQKMLILPSVSMAELIPFREPTPAGKTPEWHLGALLWRGVSIPIISFEILNGDKMNPSFREARIAVFNNVGVSEKLSFYGVVTQGIPRSIKLVSADIAKDASKPGPAEAAVVTVKGNVTSIANVDFIENEIVKAKIV